MVSNQNVLVVAAHPDDEVLGCGGTIARHTQNGDQVYVLILAEGITARAESGDQNHQGQKLSNLEKSARKANEILGVTSLFLEDFPDNRMDAVDRLKIIKKVEEFIQKFSPTTVYTHHAGDVNIDHQLTHEAVVTACRPIPGSCVKTLIFFEVASSTEWQPPGSSTPFLPNWFVDISETLELKLQALNAYEMEMRSWPHSRSIRALESLARLRGSSIGREAAEAFILGRRINSF
jgi:N-acetylglucosamine malate deacetylase 1